MALAVQTLDPAVEHQVLSRKVDLIKQIRERELYNQLDEYDP